ncbi:MAG: dockerin type I repeat-containing protein [Oscillospiraceae bacterium]|nr:dockerin type I repeat-containing protein [Oscillospiraceae bacterium]
MFKKRLKGLLAMVFAGLIAMTAIPLSVSATGSGVSGANNDFEFSTNDNGVTSTTDPQQEETFTAWNVAWCGNVTSDSSGGSSGSSGGGSSSRPTTPSYDPDKPMIDGKEKSWDDVARDIKKLSEGETKTIYLGDDMTVPADVIKAIKDSKAVITFRINSAFNWTVDGSKLTDGDIHDYDFLIEVITATGIEILRGDVGVGFKIGDITGKATLNINFKKEHAQKFANLYKKVGDELVFVDNVKIDENGAAIGLEVTEAGEYVVMLGEMSDRPGDIDNDGIMNAKDALAALKHSVGMEKGKNPVVGDMNGDGDINAKDALFILKKSVGMI